MRHVGRRRLRLYSRPERGKYLRIELSHDDPVKPAPDYDDAHHADAAPLLCGTFLSFIRYQLWLVRVSAFVDPFLILTPLHICAAT